MAGFTRSAPEGLAELTPRSLTLGQPAADAVLVAGDTEYALAPLGRRGCAWLIDATVGVLLAAGFVKVAGGARDLATMWHLMAFKSVSGQAGRQLSAAMNPATASLSTLRPLLGLLAIVTVIVVVSLIYRVVTTALWGAGVGKFLLQLRIVVEQPAQPGLEVPGWARSWRRWMVPQAAGLIPLPATGLAAYAAAVRDSRRRGLHDRAAGTIVVDLRAPLSPRPKPAPDVSVEELSASGRPGSVTGTGPVSAW
jgi:RDD family